MADISKTADGFTIKYHDNGDGTYSPVVHVGTGGDSPAASFDHGSNLDVDATAEQLTSTSFAASHGVVVKAPATNTATVYVGNSDVTAGTTAATDGMPIDPGESVVIDIDNPNKLYVIAGAVDQKVFWLAS